MLKLTRLLLEALRMKFANYKLNDRLIIMENADRYHFTDFTRENYRRLLRLSLEKYVFCVYTNIDKAERFILWRHDLDTSVHAARRIAQVEAEEGIVATYFLHLHNPFYNLLEREITECVRDIQKLGHPIALHFDTHFYNIQSEKELLKYLTFEKAILEKVFEQKIEVFSFHNTTPFILSCQKWKYAGLINTYSEFFQKQVGYCSDTNGYWRERRLEDVLTQATDRSVQVLIHPEWWQETIMSPKQRINRCIDDRAVANKKWYEQALKKFGRDNLDWE
jgi:hypothetical protein